MKLTRSENGECLYHPAKESGALLRLAGDYTDCPSDHLWIGQTHRLSRDEVREFAKRLWSWAETGTLENIP
jgi:hypothetical protein